MKQQQLTQLEQEQKKLEAELEAATRSQEELKARLAGVPKATLALTNEAHPVIKKLEELDDASRRLTRIEATLKSAQDIDNEIKTLEAELTPKQGFLEQAKSAALKLTKDGKAKLLRLEELKKRIVNARIITDLQKESASLTQQLESRASLNQKSEEINRRRGEVLATEQQLKMDLSKLETGILSLKEKIATTKETRAKLELEAKQAKVAQPQAQHKSSSVRQKSDNESKSLTPEEKRYVINARIKELKKELELKPKKKSIFSIFNKKKPTIKEQLLNDLEKAQKKGDKLSDVEYEGLEKRLTAMAKEARSAKTVQPKTPAPPVIPRAKRGWFR